MSSGSSTSQAASAPKVNNAKPMIKRLQVKQTQPIYRTRRWMWTMLSAGWLSTVAASILRGQMPEIFAAVLLSGIVIVGLLPIIAARVAGIEAHRVLSAPETTAGGELQVTLTFHMRMPLPLLWVYVREECINESGVQPRAVYYGDVGLPWRGREWQTMYKVRELARGAYRYGAMEVTLGDAFGLTAVKRVVKVRTGAQESGIVRSQMNGRARIQADIQNSSGLVKMSQMDGTAASEAVESSESRRRASFLVLPDWTGHCELPIGGGKSRATMESRPLDGSAGGYVHATERARPRQRTTVADRAGMQRQPYRPGDDARHIDWRAASRGGSWVTKREPASQPPSLLMLIDSAAEAYDGSDYWFDAAVGYAAVQIRHATANGVSFRLLDGSTHASKPVDAQQTSRLSAQREALERLTRMKPTAPTALTAAGGQPGLEGIDAVLNREGITRGATFMLITAEWRSGELGERLAAYAAANGWRIEVHVLTAKRLPSTGMRARQRDWERAGIRVVWVPMPGDDDKAKRTAIVEGGEGHEQASQ
ncbi:uncharacterized protein DUF58 [Paenibacillus cellulosilyticus]|uniref:Uncharacterized protein DUF58 n=1 Tax=Paenibacillus cellulosilyticus TaxID=375489 RepID=A0A2V2YN99_9BACL|nr:DUF58 domain-containing protein [Paenibacillus cellulosilyticus]PWV95343.1 uncharacterized protein DUF58 [Paenibacillus cellulosilyticus]QKS44048.1 DUF58 domain-containing protein [Paenibacillus cellulosilyticus]